MMKWGSWYISISCYTTLTRSLAGVSGTLGRDHALDSPGVTRSSIGRRDICDNIVRGDRTIRPSRTDGSLEGQACGRLSIHQGMFPILLLYRGHYSVIYGRV